MDAALRNEATLLLRRMPFSVEMPAGTGKTQLIAAMAGVAAHDGSASLILTHTNAGVAALRKRLKDFGVPQRMVHVDTIASWAFELVRHYPDLAGIKIAPVPDWTQTPEYVSGAANVAQARAINRMHSASFAYLFVDEYQDCNLNQHDLILEIASAIPLAAVFGDRLQGIFDFAGETLVDWDEHVFPSYPLLDREHTAWRWAGHNAELGQWLLDVRSQLVSGATLDLSQTSVPGLQWLASSHQAVADAAYGFTTFEESVLILNQWRSDNASTAGRLGGTYAVMEDLNGRFMHESLATLESSDPDGYALWLAYFAKSCFSGFGEINQPILRRLQRGEGLEGLSRRGLESTLAALEALATKPSLRNLVTAMRAIESAREGRLYCIEAWRDTLAAIEAVVLNPGENMRANLSMIRDRLRYTGRRRQQRIVSRTLLVKGLEYDHAILCDADNIGSVRNFYVAITRPRKTLTILSRSPTIRLR
ncbi:DNA/RNA helicase, superfamily I [Mycobacterium sp. JS623]|uniref:UvrD-helicase domain-containing protein n=1 Tax=Mycobacterium sp. JS623 TaxID=212767 RepID=UPI0002A5530D|nr:UvrD-helicase domain-containing protein [Mycobacterium sp. JS623]AGB22282.1 DNA/RNA helicase, superfamily I [Mycobacterium sp. JS623]